MTPPIPPAARTAWDKGDRIEAIRLVRAATGLGLAEAKSLLESTSFAAQPAAAQRHIVPAAVRNEIANGNKIAAIMQLRQATGLGLKEAKDIVDAIAAQTPSAHALPHATGLSPGEVPRSRAGLVWVVLLAVAAVAAWLMLARG